MRRSTALRNRGGQSAPERNVRMQVASSLCQEYEDPEFTFPPLPWVPIHFGRHKQMRMFALLSSLNPRRCSMW